MTTHFLTIPENLVLDLRDPITDEPLFVTDDKGAKTSKPLTYSWAEMIRAVCFDPRMRAEKPGDGKLDVFEINELRLLARAKSGEVHEISPKVKQLLTESLTYPTQGLIHNFYFVCGGTDHVRAIVDAPTRPTRDPRVATNGATKHADAEASAE